MPNYTDGSGKEIPNDAVILERARKSAVMLGIDSSKLVLKSFFTYDTNANSDLPANSVYGRGVFLSREFNGISFFASDNQGDGAEGFFIEFGNFGIVRSFTLRWSNIAYYQKLPAASPQEIIQCIRADKVIVLPDPGDETYFAKIKQMATAKRFIISQITPCYVEGIFSDMPTNGEPAKYIGPVAELDATANFENSNIIVKVLSPITSSDVHRLLAK